MFWTGLSYNKQYVLPFGYYIDINQILLVRKEDETLKFLHKMQRKLGKYCVRNLSLYVVICFSLSYVLGLLFPQVYAQLVFSPIDVIYNHEYWRLFTWIFTSPGEFTVFTLVMLYCYYVIGNIIERSIGTFLFNIYIFSGYLFTTLGIFITSLIKFKVMNDATIDDLVYGSVAGLRLTYYMLISIFLGFAIVNADQYVLFMFILPIKVKWAAYIDLAVLAYDFIVCDNLIYRVTIVASILNFIMMYFIVRSYNKGRSSMYSSYIRRKTHTDRKKSDNVETIKVTPSNITRHKCAVCGRSERDGDMLEFRFCSKCKGNYEYCNEHLFTHEHIK